MKYKTIYILLTVFFSSCFCLQAQTVEEVLKKVNTEYTSKKCLSYTSSYNLYKKATDKKAYESYKGIFQKNISNAVYQKIDKTEFVLKGNVCLKIMHPDKLIEISKAEPFVLGEFSIQPLFEYCKVKEFKSNAGFWTIELEPKQFTDLPYSKIVVTVSKSFFITKQVFYFNSGIDFSKDHRKNDISYPVLEIIHSNHKRDKIADGIFSLGKFVSFEKTGIKPSLQYSQYNIEDYR
ncbi:LolA family protein [Flavobacterium humi]|uniref:GLPGLI family protein n=1 Tax=Flavobacterium humi TaxID=2562683 RepID=A0A4Z0L5L4_9FLAO|nr:hypothetical protein [Flavobacterium humi]TGD56849.1 hypothetical protein E4635_13700 [Flavobacterium humi]